MKQVRVPGSSIATSQLGFGGAYLTGGFELRAAVRLVHVALDAGIRHFDTASSYGLGSSESVLGAALRGRRHTVTLASKAGLGRPRVRPVVSLMRAVARPLRDALRPYLQRGATNTSVARPQGDFRPESIQHSVTESLRHLHSDYLDILLLHEVRAADISDELLALLERLRREGVARALGLATEPEDIGEIVRRWPGFFEVHQCHWSALDVHQPLPAGAALQITHRALLRAFEPMRAWFAREPPALRRLAAAVDRPLEDPVVLSQVLLGAALAQNPDGIVLMASRRADRVRQNSRVAEDPALVRAGARLVAALQTEAGCPAPA